MPSTMWHRYIQNFSNIRSALNVNIQRPLIVSNFHSRRCLKPWRPVETSVYSWYCHTWHMCSKMISMSTERVGGGSRFYWAPAKLHCCRWYNCFEFGSEFAFQYWTVTLSLSLSTVTDLNSFRINRCFHEVLENGPNSLQQYQVNCALI